MAIARIALWTALRGNVGSNRDRLLRQGDASLAEPCTAINAVSVREGLRDVALAFKTPHARRLSAIRVVCARRPIRIIRTDRRAVTGRRDDLYESRLFSRLSNLLQPLFRNRRHRERSRDSALLLGEQSREVAFRVIGHHGYDQLATVFFFSRNPERRS